MNSFCGGEKVELEVRGCWDLAVLLEHTCCLEHIYLQAHIPFPVPSRILARATGEYLKFSFHDIPKVKLITLLNDIQVAPFCEIYFSDLRKAYGETLVHRTVDAILAIYSTETQWEQALVLAFEFSSMIESASSRVGELAKHRHATGTVEYARDSGPPT